MFAAAVMTASSRVMVGFVMKLCFKMCLLRMPFCSVLQMFCDVSVSRGLKLPFP